MFWPLVLPFQITCCLLAGIIFLVTIFAPSFKLKRVWTFVISSFLACAGFVPSCMCIQAIIDSQRFGEFHYDQFADVKDFRVERYLPTKAQDITLIKYATGHHAKYSISESDLKEYLDGLWARSGKQSAISREQLHDGDPASVEEFSQKFGGLGWSPLENAIELHSPVEADGGGATYYLDQKNGIAYHRAGYW